MRQGRVFEDTIGLCAFPIGIHDGQRHGQPL
ncbi:hypothetical protein [Roseomonas populi]